METMGALLGLGWVIAGWAAHIDYIDRHPTWCGVPIWREPSTYVMFFVVAMIGPLAWLIDDKGQLKK